MLLYPKVEDYSNIKSIGIYWVTNSYITQIVSFTDPKMIRRKCFIDPINQGIKTSKTGLISCFSSGKA